VPHVHVPWPLGHDTDFSQIDAVVNLVGESVAGSRWTEAVKNRIISSRIGAITELKDAFARCGHWPKVWLNASAIGYYGDRGEELLTEESSLGQGFLAETCRQWETTFTEQSRSGEEKVRKVILRIGMVLGQEGGALGKMLPLFQNGLGGRLGHGRQVMSWIHLQDLVGAMLHLLRRDDLRGVFNGVAPEPLSNQDFTKVLARQLRKSALFPAPRAILRLVLGQMSEVVLQGQRVRPQRLEASGFKFRFPRLEMALGDLLAEERDGGHTLVVRQWTPHPLEEVFDFFSRAENLERITPPFLGFKVLKISTPQVECGTLIDYRLKLHGVPLGWRTLIEEWEPPRVFVDTQLKGPYSKWHHTHTFETLGNGTLITDQVRYRLTLGPIGRLIREVWVKRDVEKIFAYRLERLEEIFKIDHS